jgi:hypothetical protein
MPRFERDPQSELVRRYARILRSAPAEATRITSAAPRALRREASSTPAPIPREGVRSKT